MIASIVPQFFTTDLPATLAFYREKFGFETQFLYGEPPFYAGTIRDGLSIFFRHIDQPLPESADKYTEEYLDAYITVNDIDLLYEDYRGRGVAFTREIGTMAWGVREFVVKDGDGRLLCFGQFTEEAEQDAALKVQG